MYIYRERIYTSSTGYVGSFSGGIFGGIKTTSDCKQEPYLDTFSDSNVYFVQALFSFSILILRQMKTFLNSCIFCIFALQR